MTFNTEDKNSDELLQEIKALRADIQSFSGYIEALYLMIKDLAEYDSTSESVRTEKTEEFTEADLARMYLRASEEDI